MEILLRPASEVPEIFVDRLQTRAPDERALATTMALDFSNNPIIDGLVEHGRPDDILAVDYFGHANGPSALLFGHRGHKQARAEFERDFPGSYVVLGEPEAEKYLSGKFIHRSHIKALAVGSRVLSLGGVNFINYNYENCVDAMLDFESEEFVDFMTDFIEDDGDLRDLSAAGESFMLAEQSQVIVDYGREKKSLIMESVFSDLMEEGVRSVVMSSSYAPAGWIYSALCKVAEAGGEVTVYTNSLIKFHKPNMGMRERATQREDLALWGLGNLVGRQTLVPIIDCLPKGKFNHLKAMVIEKEDESKVAYIGSHNFHPMSVGFGTAEVALRTTDTTVIDQIGTFITDNLAPREDRPRTRLFGLRDFAGIVSPI